MIWYWLTCAARRLVWFFQWPSSRQIARIDPNLQCPVCGWRKGKIRCVSLIDGPIPETRGVLPKLRIQCQHTCFQCGARWMEQPILKNVSPATVLPSVARGDLEKAEDRATMLEPES